MTRPKTPQPELPESTASAIQRPVTTSVPASSIEGYIRFLASYFYARGYDREDLEQEARLAVLTAPAGLERLAARRQILDVVKIANRRPLDGWPEEFDPPSRIDVAEVVWTRERLRRVLAVPLSPLQREAVRRVVRGEAYSHDKRLDNALVRARAKFREAVA